ncbi:hypothetical protein DXG01_002171 [Tephrocybe rancida]|nr:hypothetical protein DXG01_002171 [Tephrocybe rancida]
MTAIHSDPLSSLSALPKFDNTEQELAYLRAAHHELQVLKEQVKDVERVCGAVARGDLTQKVDERCEGTLRDVVNKMVEKLGLFAREVKKVSREVGTERKLGGQAQVPNAEGEWREITDVINKFASTHTSLVQNIMKVAQILKSALDRARLVMPERTKTKQTQAS